MLKKWKKTVKLFATTLIVIIYVTIGLLHSETLKEEKKYKNKNTNSGLESPPTTEKYSETIKTLVGYSKEFRLREELKGRIECSADNYPGEKDEKGKGKWTYDKKLAIKIFSAYYDTRMDPYDYVRVIGLVSRNSSLYCQIWYQNNGTNFYTTQKALIQKIWSSEWGPKNNSNDSEHPAVFSCLAPLRLKSGLLPSWVTFVDESCTGGGTFTRIQPPSKDLKKNFVICVKPVNFINVKKKNLQEWIEINKRLGADKIVFYLPNMTTSILKNEKTKGFLEKKEFSVPQPGSTPFRTFEESVWYKRKMEIIAYNDCFYSNLYHTKFVIPLDVDEIIVPKSGNNWFEAFHSHFLNSKLSEGTKNSWPEDIEKYASFSVRNAYFFPRYPKDAIIRSLMLPKRDQNIPKKLVKVLLEERGSPSSDSIFDRTIRSFRLSPRTDSVKSFVYVAKTVSVFNHYAFHFLGETIRQYIFPQNVFQLNHYRHSCDSLFIDNCSEFLSQVVFDDSLERFRNKTKR